MAKEETMICERCKIGKFDWVRVGKPAVWVADYPPTDPMPLSEAVCFDCLTHKEHLDVSLHLQKSGEADRMRRLTEAAASRMARIKEMDLDSAQTPFPTEWPSPAEMASGSVNEIADDFGPVGPGAIPLYDFQCEKCEGWFKTTDIKHGGACASCQFPRFQPGDVYASLPTGAHSAGLSELSSYSVKIQRLKTPKQSLGVRAWSRVVLFIYETTDRISEWAFQRLQPDEPIPMVCTEVDHETKTVTFDSQPKGEESK